MWGTSLRYLRMQNKGREVSRKYAKIVLESIWNQYINHVKVILIHSYFAFKLRQPEPPKSYRHDSTYSRVHSDRYRYFLLKDRTLRVSLTPSSSKPTRSTTLASLSINSWDASAQAIRFFCFLNLDCQPGLDCLAVQKCFCHLCSDTKRQTLHEFQCFAWQPIQPLRGKNSKTNMKYHSVSMLVLACNLVCGKRGKQL